MKNALLLHPDKDEVRGYFSKLGMMDVCIYSIALADSLRLFFRYPVADERGVSKSLSIDYWFPEPMGESPSLYKPSRAATLQRNFLSQRLIVLRLEYKSIAI